MTDWDLGYEPTEPQRIMHAVKATQILYGGAAGGGKSHSIRMDGLLACLQNPGCKGYLFRKTLPEIEDNHIVPLKMLMIPPEVAEFSETKKTLNFKNSSMLRFCFAEDDATIHKFQGAEMHWLGVDEAALMTSYQLRFLTSRVRLGGWKPAQEGYFPRIVYGSNPGGPSHSYLKRKFIDSSPPLTYFHDKSTASKGNPRGWRSIFIPAKMDDNPYLDAAMYAGAFTGMAPEQARALRDGDWDSVVGAALFNLTREKNMLRPFTPPRHWTHFASIDWGTFKPFSIGWYAVSEGVTLEADDGWPERYIPPGALVRFAEWYGWNGEPDSGCRLESPQVARIWLEKEEEMGLPPLDFRVGDSQMWAQMDGPSIVERMRTASSGRIMLRQGRRDRRANYAEVVARLGDQMHDNGMMAPMLFITQNCEHFWRTCPALMLDSNEPDKGPATRGQEDHCFHPYTTVLVRVGGTAMMLPIFILSDPFYHPGSKVLTEVWTPSGWRRLKNGWCSGESELWELTYERGRKIKATGNHPFLTRRGWVRLDELRFDDHLMETIPTESECRRSISTARRIGFAASIISAAARAFIAWSGNTTTALFRRATTFITRTATDPTTTSRIWSFFRPAPILATIPDNELPQDFLRTPSSAPRTPPESGTQAPRGAPGTENTPSAPAAYRQGFLTHAWSAARSVWRKLVDDASARYGVRSATSDLAILGITRTGERSEVYNLTVEGCPVFSVDHGVVVHNCYDEVCFATAQRPIVTTQAQRREMEMDAFAEKYNQPRRGGSADPYAWG